MLTRILQILGEHRNSTARAGRLWSATPTMWPWLLSPRAPVWNRTSRPLELLGECYIHLAQSQKAVVPLAAATTLNDQVPAPGLLSDVLAQLGDTYNARRICEIALGRDPQNKIARKVHEQLTVGSDLIEKE